MIKPDLLYTKSLEQFYQEIVRIQQDNHGKEYTAHHLVLSKYAADCSSIKELGVCQGATLAVLLLCKPKTLIGIDIDDQYFTPYSSLFYKYAINNKINFEFIKGKRGRDGVDATAHSNGTDGENGTNG